MYYMLIKMLMYFCILLFFSLIYISDYLLKFKFKRNQKKYQIYSSTLSPYGLKIKCYFDMSKITNYNFGFGSNVFEQLYYTLKAILVAKSILPVHTPFDPQFDEFTLVPYVFCNNNENLFNSTEIAYYIPQIKEKIIPVKRSLSFLCMVMDEFFDEWGMYLFYHHRWSLKENQKPNNTSGDCLSKEYLLPTFLKKPFANYFNTRQHSRLAYLFSTRETKMLLEDSYQNILSTLEDLFQDQPFLLGNKFSLCDASLYGIISTNIRNDEFTSQNIKNKYPRVYNWIINMFSSEVKNKGGYYISNKLKPIFKEMFETLIPIMRKMETLYDPSSLNRNETAFNNNQSLFKINIKNVECKTVVKTFQVYIWRKIKREWLTLNKEEQKEIMKVLPIDEIFI
jgi:hypothetical protein